MKERVFFPPGKYRELKKISCFNMISMLGSKLFEALIFLGFKGVCIIQSDLLNSSMVNLIAMSGYRCFDQQWYSAVN